MGQFDVHSYEKGGVDVPYLLDVQSDLLSGLNVRVVVPLVPVQNYGLPIRHLNPVFEIQGREYVMAALELGSILTADLGPVAASLARRRDDIVRALDTVIQGV